jgi:glycosyltransferase involved in cell wall biosynthesis
MTISVVIATYNRAPLLQAALSQLRTQQYGPDDEVIVVDNGSTDDTAAVIARAAAGFPCSLRRLVEPTPGKTPALSRGLAAAHGDVLALTDDDVLVADDWIATMRQLFSDSRVDLVGGRVDPNWERPAPAWLRLDPDQHYGRMASPLALLHYGAPQDLGGRTAVGANMAVRRSVLDQIGGFAPHLGRQRGTLLCGEDHEFTQRAVAGGYRCEYRPELRVRHWVQAERLRFRYYLRWFFWSGVTSAVLERNAPHGSAPVSSGYLARRLARAPATALVHTFHGRQAGAAESAMDGAFALGYLWRRVRDRIARGANREAPDAVGGGSRAAAGEIQIQVAGTQAENSPRA